MVEEGPPAQKIFCRVASSSALLWPPVFVEEVRTLLEAPLLQAPTHHLPLLPPTVAPALILLLEDAPRSVWFPFPLRKTPHPHSLTKSLFSQ